MKKYNLEDLVYLLERLREPEFGCPWDIKQDFSSIIPYTLEECYEVVDAIEQRDWPHLCEELGDLLFQILFYSQLAREQQLFDLSEVIHQLVSKLIRRHPHVFLDSDLHAKVAVKPSEQQIAESWEAIKVQERLQKSQTQKNSASSLLDDIPKALPALQRADKLQRRAAKVGFDWCEITPVIEKIEEELAELKEAIASGDIPAIKDEMGDLLFSQVNLARHLGVNAEEALRGTNNKFSRRFGYVEQSVRDGDKDWQQYSLDELDGFWHEAKLRGL
ncbi:MAG: nucleoside triphosphate pyrophosphohydrolase [Pseudomonadales bacterium]|nr:nucleoside triphosphate pyrophosphohydrolase [Pseudomonadales bacterium]